MVGEPVPDPVEAAGRLRLSVTRLARQLRQQSDTGLTPTLLVALATVERHGPLSIGELAEHEQVAAPTMSRIISKLESEGLVQRAEDPSDRRSSLVGITRSGRSVLERSRTRKTAWLTSRIAELPADLQVRLADAVEVLDALASADRSAR